MRGIIRRVGPILLVAVLIPLALLLAPVLLIIDLLGLTKSSAGPDYVAGYLERFLAGTEREWDWDDFCSVPLKDPRLDSIREQVCNFGPPNPMGDFERAKLTELLHEVQVIDHAKTA